ncbi:MAG: alpha amylase C-terminal domain-containing protein, partial [Rhodothermia bacterium]|nr:alpha amylase C-terminal domain-containing protein [Rhodothermia bacterium]
HTRGIRVIIDGVFNHVGVGHWAFRDVVEKGQESPYAEWFTIKDWGSRGDADSMQYESWWGFRELPEWREDESGIVAGPRKYIFDITRRWMDPLGAGDTAKGIDGWRLDVAFCVSHAFWKDWRRHVKSINADAYLVAEVVDSIEENKPFLRGDEFDAVMNYNFAFACAEFFVEDKTRIVASEFDRRLAELRNAFPGEIAFVQQNLIDSHDSDRFSSHIVNRNLGGYRAWMQYHQLSKASNPDYDTRKPTDEEIAMQKVVAIFQMTYLGAPMLYYGDEAGMWGANDPCCRKPMVWDDMDFDPSVCTPDGSRRSNPDPVVFNTELHAHYRKLIRIRNRHEALRRGDFRAVLADNEAAVYVFARQRGSKEVVVAVSASTENQQISVDGVSGRYRDVLNEEHLESDGSVLTFSLASRWGRILVREA